MSLNLAAATVEDIEQARADCRRMVSRRAYISGVAVLVPLPGTDMLADVGMLKKLIPKVNERFGLSEAQLNELNPEMKIVVLDLAKRLGGRLIGRLVTREVITTLLTKAGVKVGVKGIAKFVPLIGQAAAASLSIAVMRYVGNAHVDECYNVTRRFIEKREHV
jgi:uncharacterized protein (DUF697 family)